MAIESNIIKIKRSGTSGAPASLKLGELAYSYLTASGNPTSNGGDRLFVGANGVNAGTGNANDVIVIGGKYFTDLLDHERGLLTASSALIVDVNKKLDELLVDNLSLNGNALSTTNTNGNLTLSPNGTGLVSIAGAFTLPRADGTNGYVLTTNGAGVVSWQPTAATLNIAGTTGTDGIILTTETLTFAGATTPVTVAVTANTVTVAVADATTSAKGLASFNATDFTVTSGAVTVNAERIEDIVGAMVSTNTESGISVTYDDINGKLDFNVNDPVITIAGDVDGFATMTNLGDTTITVTLDTVNTNVGQFGSSTAIPVITVNGKGLITAVSTATISTTLNIAGTTGTDAVALGSDTLTFAGSGAISTAVTNNQVAISVATATSSVLGVASFNTASFTVTAGDVTIKSAGVSNAQLVNSSVTVGTTSISLGATSTSLTGLTQLDVDNITVNGNEISSTDTNGNISLNPNGTGTVAVNSSRITGLADPTDAQDAATKAYVDARSAGLDPKASVRAATTTNITLSNTQTVDGIALAVGNRVLVKDQTTASQNGIYIVASSAWTRSSDMDEPAEMSSGVFFFVEEGTANADAGFVITTDGGTIVVGTDAVNFTQFSGAGQIVAGDGLSKTGNTLAVNVAGSGGIEISADALQLKSTVAGNGLTYTNGVIDVTGTSNRISVTADAVDIASTYVGQSSITTLGTISTGTWNGSLIGATYGGTGVNNGSNTITIGGNVNTGGAVTFSGAYGFTGTLTATTSVTFPTTGTLVNTAVTSLSSLATVGTITSGTWNGTAITYAYGGTGQTTYAKGDFLYASAANTLSKLTAGTNGQTLQLQEGVPFWGDLDGGTY